MKRNDYIIDFETLGRNADECAVLDCSTLCFEWERFLTDPYTFEELIDTATRYKLDIKEQVANYGFKIEKDTLNFWLQQSPETQKSMKPRPSDLSVADFTRKLMFDLCESEKIEYWWSRNNSFDPTILWRLVCANGNSKFEIEQYLMHWRLRDVKTWIDAKFDFTTLSGFVPISDKEYWEKNFMEHNSSHDIAADILRLQTINRAENDLKQTEK